MTLRKRRVLFRSNRDSRASIDSLIDLSLDIGLAFRNLCWVDKPPASRRLTERPQRRSRARHWHFSRGSFQVRVEPPRPSSAPQWRLQKAKASSGKTPAYSSREPIVAMLAWPH